MIFNYEKFMKKIYELLLASIFLIFFLYSTSEIIAFTLLSIRRESATQTVPDYAGGISYKPNRLIKLKGYPGNLFTDNYGFVHNGERNRKINKNSIFIFGGSTIEGIGSSSNGKTIPAFLEKCLFSKNIKKQVINVGHAGDYSEQQKSRLFHRILVNYNPSLVIFFDGRNDAHYSTNSNYFSFSANPTLWQQNKKTEFKGVQPRFFPNLSILYRRIIRKLNLNSTNSDNLKTKSYGLNIDVNKNSISAATSYHKIGDEVQDQLYKLGIPFIRILQPTLIGSSKIKTNQEIQFINNFLISNSSRFSNNQYKDIIISFYKKVKNIKKNYLHDMSNLFDDNHENLYTDSVHYNDLSNKIISENICKIILKKKYLFDNQL